MLESRTNWAPFHDAVERLTEVPGLGMTATQVVLAEIGLDMSLFPSAGHLLSWAGFVPRLDESAGKTRSTRIRKGAPWLKPVLVQAAWGATRKKNSSDVAAGVERKRFQNLGGWSDDYPQYPVEVLNRAVIRLRCV